MKPGPRPGEKDTTDTDVTADVVPACEVRPLGIAKQSATTKSDIAVCSGEDGPSQSKWYEQCRTSAGEARPPRFVKYSFTSESEPELAKFSARFLEKMREFEKKACTAL